MIRTLIAIFVAILILSLPSAGIGQDRIVLRSESGASEIPLTGSILEYTGEELTIRTGPDAVRVYEAERILGVETPQTEPHRAAIKAFQERRFQDAFDLTIKAVEEEQRQWVRREILALRVKVALALGDRIAALDAFLSIVTSDPTSRHFSLIPLPWRLEPPPKDLVAAARIWMRGGSEVSRLCGASVLILSEDESERARAELDQLAISFDERVYHLARAQLWRGRMAREGNSASRGVLANWQDRVRNMPETLRGGTFYLIGKSYGELLDHEQAAAALLWLPLVYDSDQRLAAEAEWRAAVHLRAIGRSADAVTLCSEVMGRFAHTPAAKQAEALLDEIRDEVSSGGAN
ncbi:hypothetical protein [Stratiformator vulcanicus]|uniref:Tetratricopeptide repeat protein n=1 Tax=Stratiformator vulcanicus TaxID=2527980 RepID=A0A517QZI4_9PLAN|nr:hypothetical protein [Stratiformator vulcanicus]QDT37018.1 hypothetical protein Pan189_13840 [Stratiformator vulcanicus]